MGFQKALADIGVVAKLWEALEEFLQGPPASSAV